MVCYLYILPLTVSEYENVNILFTKDNKYLSDWPYFHHLIHKIY